MLFSLNVYPAAFSIVMFALMSLIMCRRSDIRGARAFSISMFFAMISTLILLLAISVRNPAHAAFIIKFYNLPGDCFATTAFVVMVARYSGNRFFSRPVVIAGLAVVPFMTFIFAQTGGFFHYNYHVISTHGWRLIEFSRGPWHVVSMFYLFVISGIDLYMLIRYLYESKRQRFASTLLLIFVSITFYMQAFIMTVIGRMDTPAINYNVYVWSVAGLVVTVALYISRSQRLIPIARDAVVESTNEIMLILNPQDTIVDLNRAAANALGMDRKKIVGRPAVELLAGWGEVPRFITENTEGIVKQHINTASGEMTCILSMTLIDGGTGENMGRLLVFHDITEMERREESERHAKQLRTLSQRTIAAQEEERNRLGRELHDDFGHKFLTLSLNIETIRKKNLLPGQEIDTLSNLVRDISISLMSIYKGLKPTVIARLGLTAAIESQLQEIKSQGTLFLKYDLDMVGKDDLPYDTALGVYRIFQESMTNIFKHSGATEVEVKLERLRGGIKMSVADNGCGMDLKSDASRTEIGMIGMKERTALLGGELNIESSPGGRGTTVALVVPANERDAEDIDD